MPTECSRTELDLGSSGGRRLVGAFDGGAITSNGGVVLLAAADRAIGLSRCFTDLRLADAVRHSLPDLLRQRIFGLALGHEDLIDHDVLRDDPALAAVLDKPGGRLAGKSTLNRMEHAGKIGQDRHHKLDHDVEAIERLFVDIFLDAHAEPPSRIVLDLDATDDPLYGEQEGRHFHGYYDCYCYLPLYIFCGRHLLAAKLRKSSVDAGAAAPLAEQERQQQRIIVAPAHSARPAAQTAFGSKAARTAYSVSIIRRHSRNRDWEKAGLALPRLHVEWLRAGESDTSRPPPWTNRPGSPDHMRQAAGSAAVALYFREFSGRGDFVGSRKATLLISRAGGSSPATPSAPAAIQSGD